jgi:hypothetical protein
MRTGLLLLTAAVVANAVELKPYEMIWRPGESVLVDLSFLHEAPAGKHGFVTVRNGHLAKGNGERLRIWGVNFSFTASVPPKELAPAVATHLARFGINCVRVHHLDWRTPRGIIDSRHADSRHLDPDLLDRLDFFVSELRKRGIYTNLNLNVARSFQAADGVKDAGQLGFAKAITLFDPRIIELQKEYARTLLAHRNPYTGNEYRNEPSLSMVEIVNENSLVESWVRGRLQGKGPGKGSDQTWTDITPSYERDLTALYHRWLAKRGKPAVARLRPNEFGRADPDRFRTEALFYMDLENTFFQEMERYLKSELGVKMPVVGTSIHSGGLSPYPLLTSTSKLDIVDAHTYWQHPSYLSDPETGRRTGFEIRNTPSVNEPDRSAVVTLARVAVAGKPFIVSEVNHPYPNEWASEGIPLLAAYGSFQDWDGIFWYSFEHSAADTWDTPKLPGHFDMRRDPVKMTEWAAGALTFLRGDVAPAKKMLHRTYSTEQVTDSLRLPSSEAPFFTKGLSPALPLVHGVRVSSFDKPYEALPAIAGSTLVSDTGELQWRVTNARGTVTVNTARTQSVIGFLHTDREPVGSLSAALSNEFGAITLTSLDQAPIAKSGRLLLITAGRAANQGLTWNDKRTRTTSNGEPGMTVETMEGAITLTGLAGAEAVEAIPLDGGGRSAAEAIKAQKDKSGWRIPVGAVTTPWYFIRVAR